VVTNKLVLQQKRVFLGLNHRGDDDMLHTSNVNPCYMPVDMKGGPNRPLRPGEVLAPPFLGSDSFFSKSKLKVEMPFGGVLFESLSNCVFKAGGCR